jgi:hypothetical protein
MSEIDEGKQTYYGKDCPKGMVQIEFVGCKPEDKHSEYGWKPVKSAFLEVWVDGQRFRIDVGTSYDGRRGLHIVGMAGMNVKKDAINACSVWYGSEADEEARHERD